MKKALVIDGCVAHLEYPAEIAAARNAPWVEMLVRDGAHIGERVTPIRLSDIDVERDKRLVRFAFEGVSYDFDALSRARIDKSRGSALPAILAGAQVGDYRWADQSNDFGWIDAANVYHLMDAHTCLAFGNAAASWEGRHIIAGRVLKNMNPIPANYTSDEWWP